MQVALDPIDHLDSFADAVAAGDIHVTLDDHPLELDPMTGFTQQGGTYISQQYVTLPRDANPGDTIIVTGTRWDDAQDSGAAQLIAQIKNRYTATQP